MEVRSLVVRRLALVLIALSLVTASLSAQSQRARIALFEPCGQSADATLTAALCTVADSVELSLACLQRYEVKRLPAVDPTKDLDKVRAYCQANRIDQAIAGSGSARSTGGYAFQLVVYDRRSDSITFTREGASEGALDMFDATDVLVAALLDGLSGTHLLFGSLVIETDPLGAAVSVNGTDVGPSPLSLRGLPVGAVTVSAQSSGREKAETSATIVDGETATVSLRLARSMGALTLNMPDDAMVLIRGTDTGERTIRGGGPEQLPTGSYEVLANCPGLDPVTQTITIQRNETNQWVPWQKGYLNVQPDPPAATVVLDGQEKGLSPLVLEVEPGTLHTLELKKAKYLYYRADLSAPSARKVVFEPQLVGSPGSIRVETDPAGASVQVDNGDWREAPFTFSGVTAGTHTVTVDDLLLSRHYYTSANKFSVTVSAEEQATLPVTLVPGKARVRMTGIPAGGTVTADGMSLDPAQLAGKDGVEIPAGQLDLVLTTSAGQKWTRTIIARPGQSDSWDRRTWVASLPRRTIKVDGKVDDWDGILPIWEVTIRSSVFPKQRGTHITRGYLCRDDRFLYLRMDFDDGKPLRDLTTDVKDTLVYDMQVRVPGGNLITNISSNRQWGINTWIGFWDSSTRIGSQIENNASTYAVGESSLELEVPWNFVEKYLKEGQFSASLDVADNGQTGWNQSLVTDNITIDFVK